MQILVPYAILKVTSTWAIIRKTDVHTCANSSTEMTRFPSLSKYSKAVLAIFSHPSWASSWYVLIAATQNSSKSNFLCESGSILNLKLEYENIPHAKATITQIEKWIKKSSFVINPIDSVIKTVFVNRNNKPKKSNKSTKDKTF